MAHASNLPILLVDDNEAHRSLIKRAITKAALSNPIVEAESLQAARLKLFEDVGQEYALAILDLNLGDGRSTLLVSEIRASKSQPELPILTLSTSSLPNDVFESYQHGCDCFLTKSDDISLFTKEIGSAVRFLLRS